jgi:DNA-binding NarL/FixJ family response regulator
VENTFNIERENRKVIFKLSSLGPVLKDRKMTVLTTISYKTLIVEDNDGFRQALRSLLSSRYPFMSFKEARDGKEALNEASSFDPDLIFMDIKLPGENGLELTRKIKAANPEVKIVILTNHDLPEYREAVRAGGADHFLTKASSKASEIFALVDHLFSKTHRTEK